MGVRHPAALTTHDMCVILRVCLCVSCAIVLMARVIVVLVPTTHVADRHTCFDISVMLHVGQCSSDNERARRRLACVCVCVCVCAGADDSV